MRDFIPLSVPNFIGNEQNYVSQAIQEGWVSTGGKAINDFELAICKYVHSQHAVAVQSGTAGLHLSLIAVGVKPGDEVIVPTLTFIAAVNPVKYCGADPIFMDCDDSLCMDMNKLEQFIDAECEFDGKNLIHKTNNKIIRAVVAVHVFGNLCNMEALMKLAKKYNLKVVEDATEALGSYFSCGEFENVRAGLVGDVGVYSFNGNKIITTGGGGMIVSNNGDIANYCKYLSQQAKDDTLYFVHNKIGYNYRMTNLQAALGLAQLECLDKFIQTKQENYEYYLKKGVYLLKFREDIYSNFWFYSFLTESPEKRDSLITYMNNNNIQTRPIWTLIHSLEPYKNCCAYKIEKAKYFQDRIVNLPCSTSLTKEDIDYVVDCLKGWNHSEN